MTVLRTLEVALSGGGSPGCTLVVTPWSGRLAVPAHGRTTQRRTATASAGAVCTGVSWTLTYRAGG